MVKTQLRKITSKLHPAKPILMIREDYELRYAEEFSYIGQFQKLEKAVK